MAGFDNNAYEMSELLCKWTLTAEQRSGVRLPRYLVTLAASFFLQRAFCVCCQLQI
jgi:hypothetical protein